MKQDESKYIKVGICVPSTGTWEVNMAKSLVMAVAKFQAWKNSGYTVKGFTLLTQQTSMLVASRHQLVLSALKEGCTHIFFVDSDMIFPPETLVQLIQRDKDVVAVNCTTRSFPVEHVAHDLKGERLDSRKKYGLQKVQHVGLAVALIRAEVFKRMSPPLFMMEWIPDLQSYCGEDIYFCAKVQHLGYDIYIDHNLSHMVTHRGKFSYGPGHLDHEVPIGAILDDGNTTRKAS